MTPTATSASGTNANFTYGTSGWLDKLLSYNGNSISYDAIGNPTVWHDGSTFTWTNGKQLTAATAADGTVLSYSYDADGLRLTKVVDGITHNYLWQGDRLVSEQYGSTELEFFYDESGAPYAFDYNGTIYYYITNLQGDVIGIVDASGVSKATYKYNAWGMCKVLNPDGTENTDASFIGNQHFRYRKNGELCHTNHLEQ